MCTWEEGIYCLIDIQKMKGKKPKQNLAKNHQFTKEDSKRGGKSRAKLHTSQKTLTKMTIISSHLPNVKELNLCNQRNHCHPNTFYNKKPTTKTISKIKGNTIN